jgi:protein subunit release factor A
VSKELIFSVTKKDLKIEWFSGTGAGGQHRNKHQNCLRLHHPDSGVMVTGQSNRDRVSNTREALQNLIKHPKFRIWIAKRNYELQQGKTVEQIVEDLMEPSNLKIEAKDGEGNWKEVKILDKTS